MSQAQEVATVPKKQLHILKNSLRKKEEQFNARLQSHFDTVAQANGQPLNDKRNGHRTIQQWERQNDALRTLNQSIEKTKAAIEREETTSDHTEAVKQQLPQPIVDLINNGTLSQWNKYPNRLFVNGVQKGRIVWDFKKKVILASHHKDIPNQEQYARFRDVFNDLKNTMLLNQ